MSEIWTPPGAGPKHQCNVCGEQFYDTEKYVRHVAQCAQRNRGRLLEMTEEHAAEEAANPLIAGLPFDEEAMEFQRRRYGER